MGTEMVLVHKPNKSSKCYVKAKTNCFSTNTAWVFHSNSKFPVFWGDISILPSYCITDKPKLCLYHTCQQ